MTFVDHKAHIAAAPEQFRPTLHQLHATLKRALPDAAEIIAYNMPGCKIGDTVVASYAAFSKQCGLYLQAEAITEHAAEIAAAGLKASKTGVTFTVKKSIPNDLVERLAQASRDAVI